MGSAMGSANGLETAMEVQVPEEEAALYIRELGLAYASRKSHQCRT